MALAKQNISVNFGKGIDNKSDPLQLSPGQFQELVNTVFNKGGQLTKRNGYGLLSTIPQASRDISAFTNLTTFKGDLIATSVQLLSYNEDSDDWITKGTIAPVAISATPLVRTSTSQETVDAAVSNGLVCSAWQDSDGKSYYVVCDASSGQTLVSQTQLQTGAKMPRVFALGNYLVVTYLVSSGGFHLRYVAIPVFNPQSPIGPTDIATAVESDTAAYDGYVAGDILYVAYSAASPSVRVTRLTSTLIQGGTHIIPGNNASRISVTADTTGVTPIVWVTRLDSLNDNIYTQTFDFNIQPLLTQTTVYSANPVNNLASVAEFGVLVLFTEQPNTYTYTPNAETNYIQSITVTSLGVVGSPNVTRRGVGLASKAWIVEGRPYVMAAYGQALQPTYFMLDVFGNIAGKLAYSNGNGYVTTQILPSITSTATHTYVGYLFVDLLVPVNKEQGAPTSDGVYTQTGINLATFEFPTDTEQVEIGGALHLSGGYLSMYDGNMPVEHGFYVWPEDIQVETSTSGGSLSAQEYFYQVTYEWTDAAGNIHRSAPSVPISITTTGSTSSNTLHVPTLRLTYKTNVRIVVYRWSTAQQTYYQIGGPTFVNANDPSVDSIDVVDTFSDAQILGNNIVYTTGGVVENIGAPGNSFLTLFKARLFLVDNEDRNLIWYSKQVIEATPVEMSDLFTIYVAPTIGSQGSTGPITALSNMDDKLIVFKENAIYYITGQGPDNTGANNDFSDPVFITSAVGCTNSNSIVQTPMGIMFQSNKGIWLLGRDLSTKYIGAPVESFNSTSVNSAVLIPGTNQVRFTLSEKNQALVYDYYFDQWSTFSNVQAISSVISSGLHTYLATDGRVFRETPGQYLDGAVPVTVSFLSAWLSLAGLQGFQRFYQMLLLGVFKSPHNLFVGFAYDYDSAITQQVPVSPTNFDGFYGDYSLYGSSEAYSKSNIEQWRVNPERQKCQAVQVSLREVFDPSFGTVAGQGLTLSAMNLVVGLKKGYTPKAVASTAG